MDQVAVNPTYIGTKRGIFWLSVKAGVLTAMTLGIYRFWQKSRIRRYVWSSVHFDGDPAEYTGTGLEKYFGFLFALVILAVYLGIVQVLLTFAGFNLMGILTDSDSSPLEDFLTSNFLYGLSLLILPFVFFAQYRGRRYMLARTRWRGMRFAMTPGAGGFVWRALLWSVLSVVTLGIMTPYYIFNTTKYMVDRQWYGDVQFEQGGSWRGLFWGTKHLIIGFVLLIAGTLLIAIFDSFIGAIMIFVAFPWAGLGLIYWRIYTFRYLTDHMTLDGEIRFKSKVRMGKVIQIYLVGSLLLALVAVPALFVPFMTLGALVDQIEQFNRGAILALSAVSLLALAIVVAAYTAFIRQPLLIHYLTTLQVLNAASLNQVCQRMDDTTTDADGFANALDVGGGF